MGNKTRNTNGNQANRGQDRFSSHFPRLFAYAYGVTGDAEAAKEVTLACFSNVLNVDSLNEHDFTQALYTAARKFTEKKRNSTRDGLTATERDIVSLLFDAEMSRGEVAELLGIENESLLTTLVGGLKKLRVATPATLPGHLQTLSA